MNNHKITNLATPTASTDAATKGYVDNSSGGTCSFSRTIRESHTCVCPSGFTAWESVGNMWIGSGNNTYDDYISVCTCLGSCEDAFCMTARSSKTCACPPGYSIYTSTENEYTDGGYNTYDSYVRACCCYKP